MRSISGYTTTRLYQFQYKNFRYRPGDGSLLIAGFKEKRGLDGFDNIIDEQSNSRLSYLERICKEEVLSVIQDKH